MKPFFSSLGLAAIALAGPIQDRQEEGQAVRAILQVDKAGSRAAVVASNADRSEVYGQACSTKLASGAFADHPISFDVGEDGHGTVTVGSRESIVRDDPATPGGVSCGALSSASEVLITCNITVPHSLPLRPLARQDLAPCFAEPFDLETALAGFDQGAIEVPASSKAGQAFNVPPLLAMIAMYSCAILSTCI